MAAVAPARARPYPVRGCGGAGWGVLGLTLGAEAEVGGGNPVLVPDLTAVRAAVHFRRPHDGQGRGPLVPCTAGSDLPVRCDPSPLRGHVGVTDRLEAWGDLKPRP